jgi:hypothetical protein
MDRLGHADRRSGCRVRECRRRLGRAGFATVAACPISLAKPSGRCLSFAECEEIAIRRAQDCGVREIARLSSHSWTISRELRHNAATRCGKLHYRAIPGRWKADQAARWPRLPG